MNVKNAEKVANLDNPLKVRGKENMKQAIAMMNEKAIVQNA